MQIKILEQINIDVPNTYNMMHKQLQIEIK